MASKVHQSVSVDLNDENRLASREVVDTFREWVNACIEAFARGAAAAGLTWYYARPPVEGLDYEMDLRGVSVERVV